MGGGGAGGLAPRADWPLGGLDPTQGARAAVRGGVVSAGLCAQKLRLHFLLLPSQHGSCRGPRAPIHPSSQPPSGDRSPRFLPLVGLPLPRPHLPLGQTSSLPPIAASL